MAAKLNLTLEPSHTQFVKRQARKQGITPSQVVHDALVVWARQCLPFDEFRKLFPVGSS
jgi:hypothetical protein